MNENLNDVNDFVLEKKVLEFVGNEKVVEIMI